MDPAESLKDIAKPGRESPNAIKQGGVRHFVVIDGLRGIAAILVFLYHLVLFVPGLSTLPGASLLTNHGYLCVDVFFVISGFVIAHAFDGRIERGMSLIEFMARRVIRLYPMIFIGFALGSITLAALWFLNRSTPLANFALAEVAGFFLIPTTALQTLKPYVFPVNSAYWSLSFEMLLYLVYAITYPVLRGIRVAALVVLGACLLIWGASAAGTVNVGFLVDNYAYGFCRVVYPFFFGVLMRRMPALPILRLNACYLCVPILVLAIVNPIPASTIYDLFIVLFVAPLCAYLAVQPGSRAGVERMLAVAGKISYPLYAIHFPLVLMVGFAFKGANRGLEVTVAISVIFAVALIICSYYIDRIYDEPVRRYLSGLANFKKRQKIAVVAD